MADQRIGGGYVEISAKGVEQAEKKIKSFGSSGAMSLMMVSQAIDDVQYGFKAIVNNIPMLGMSLGKAFGASSEGAMKFGAIAGIAAVAINTIINHWDQLFDRFGYGTETMRTIWQQFWGDAKDITVDALDVIENRIKELQNKPIKTAVDLHETEELKKQAKELQAGRQAFDQMGKGRSPFEKESGEKIGQLFADTDAATMKRLQTDLVTKRAEAMNATSPAVQKATLTAEEEAKIRQRFDSTAGVHGGYAALNPAAIAANKAAQDAAVEAEKKRRADAASLTREVNKQKAADELGVTLSKSLEGNTAEQQKLIEALRGAGYHGLAAQVQSLSPEAAADAASMKTQQEADARKAAINEMLTEQGKAGERDMLAERADERSREAARFAQQLQPRLSEGLTSRFGITQWQLEDQVKEALQKAGVAADDIGKMTTEVAAKLRLGVEDRIRAKVLGGLTEEQAMRSVKQEDREAQQALKRLPKSEIMSTEGYLNKLLVAGMSRESTEPKPMKLADDQIGGLNDRLDQIKEAVQENKPDGLARFAAGRRR